MIVILFSVIFIIKLEAQNVFIMPASIESGTLSTFKISYIVGENGIVAGGGIKIQYPKGFHAQTWKHRSVLELFFKHPQTESKSDWDYVGAITSNKNVKLTTDVLFKTEIDTISGEVYRRGQRVFYTKVLSGNLTKGDTINLIYANTTASVIKETIEIPLAVDATGSGTFVHLQTYPKIKIIGGEAREFVFHGPSKSKKGQKVLYRIVALDKHGNQAENFKSRFILNSDDPDAILPKTVDMYSGNGIVEFSVIWNTPGIHRIHLTDNRHLANTGMFSNPVIVSKDEPKMNVYWGDLHSHSKLSGSAGGKIKTAYDYGKDVAGLDFMALTPQRERWERPNRKEYEENRKFVKAYHKNHEFITFLGFEWQSDHHNNAFFLSDNEEIPFAYDFPTVEELWKSLEGKDAITIPHHTGVRFLGYFPGYRQDFEDKWVQQNARGMIEETKVVDWSKKSPFRPTAEIYSSHGSSEYFMSPGNYEEIDNTFSAATPGPYYLRDAWEAGQVIGVLGSTDDHYAHPGRFYGGITGVYAKNLTRESVFNAIRDRHTFATTGHRLLLDFRMNGHLMGSKIKLEEKDETPEFTLKVNAVDVIEKVEVFKYDGFNWTTIFESKPSAKDLQFQFKDYGFKTSSLYYVRVTQKALYTAPVEQHARKIMAWTSPIWVTKRDIAWWDILPATNTNHKH